MLARWLWLLISTITACSAWANEESNIALLIQEAHIDSMYVESIKVKSKSPDRDVNLSATLGLIDDLYIRDEFAGITLYRYLVDKRNRIILDTVIRNGQFINKTYTVVTPNDRRFKASPLIIKAFSNGTTLRKVQGQEHIIMQKHGGDASTPEDYREAKKSLKGIIYQKFMTGEFTSTEIFYTENNKIKSKKAKFTLRFKDFTPGMAWLEKDKGKCRKTPLTFFHTGKNEFMGGITNHRKECAIPKLGNRVYLTIESETSIRLKPTEGSGFMVFIKKTEDGKNVL